MNTSDRANKPFVHLKFRLVARPCDPSFKEEQQGQRGSRYGLYKQRIQIRKSYSILFTAQYQRVGIPAANGWFNGNTPCLIGSALAAKARFLTVTAKTESRPLRPPIA